MYLDKAVAVILPAYNASSTLAKTVMEIPSYVDHLILVDDASNDDTGRIAFELGIKHVVFHNKNEGYGANQKTSYDYVLKLNPDIIVMIHPDYQYTPLIMTSLVHMLASGVYDVVLASRILGVGALAGGMPVYKFIANRILTFFQNILLSHKLSEYHTGYRAYAYSVLTNCNYKANSNDFVFDNQILSQAIYKGFRIGEVSCPTRYDASSSSISFSRSVTYGIGVIIVSFAHLFCRFGLHRPKYLNT